MSVDITVDQSEQSIRVSGDLVASTVMQALQRFTRECNGMQQWVIDFSEVGRVDSTAIALLIEVKRKAQAKDKSVRFVGLPESLLRIAHLSQVESLLQDSA